MEGPVTSLTTLFIKLEIHIMESEIYSTGLPIHATIIFNWKNILLKKEKSV